MYCQPGDMFRKISSRLVIQVQMDVVEQASRLVQMMFERLAVEVFRVQNFCRLKFIIHSARRFE